MERGRASYSSDTKYYYQWIHMSDWPKYSLSGASSSLSSFPSTSSLIWVMADLRASSWPINFDLASRISRSRRSNVESTHSRLALLSRALRSAFWKQKQRNIDFQHCSKKTKLKSCYEYQDCSSSSFVIMLNQLNYRHSGSTFGHPMYN